MSILTKVFVVLVTVLAVGMTAVVVATSANVENIRAMYREEHNKVANAEGNARARQLEKISLQEQLAQANTATSQQVQALDTINKSQASQLEAANAKVAQAEQQRQLLLVDIQKLSNSFDQQAKQLEAMLKDQTELQKASSANQRATIELTQKNQEQGNTIEALTRQVRMFEEQIARLTQERDELAKIVAGSPELRSALTKGTEADKVEGKAPQGPALTGTVTEVSKQGDKTWIQINLGTVDQVVKSREFIVHRQDTYLGKLVVYTVDPNSSVGYVELEKGQIKVGDSVQTAK